MGGCGRQPDRPTLGAARDGGDAQRLVALLDYVGGDYGRAVKDGAVSVQAEYDEQLRFVKDAKALALALLGGAADDPLLALLAQIEGAVRGKADADVVARACHVARDAAVLRFDIPTIPTSRPSLERAQTLYTQNCQACHGPTGEADTERARALDPSPARFRDPARLAMLSPYRVYNALTFGVSGTAMASFDALSPRERWDLAFYVFRLGHAGEQAAGPVPMALADMATRSDREILEALRDEGSPAPALALAHIRREAPFTPPPAGAGAEEARALVRTATRAFEAGRAEDAVRLAIDAYLQGFEPLEAQLRARDAAGTLAIETAFRDLRVAMAAGDAAAVRTRSDALDALLFRIAFAERRPVVPFVAAAIIYFREGIEAALLVGALLAALRKLGRSDAARYIHAGWLLALPAGVLTWWLLDRVLVLGAAHRELVEAGVALVAAMVLFCVSFWMISKAESRQWMAYLQRSLERSVSRRSLAVLAGLAFMAVYREAAETVLFTQALFLDAGGNRSQVWLGSLAGALAAMAAAVIMNRTVLRLPIGPFFAVSGTLLCALAISFAGSGIYGLVQSGYLAPRPVRFPEIPWMGIHPDLTGLAIQLLIVGVIGGAAIATLRRQWAEQNDPRP